MVSVVIVAIGTIDVAAVAIAITVAFIITIAFNCCSYLTHISIYTPLHSQATAPVVPSIEPSTVDSIIESSNNFIV